DNDVHRKKPRGLLMNREGVGGRVDPATDVGDVSAKIRERSGDRGEVHRVTGDPAKTRLDPKRIEAVLGVSGALKDGVYKVVIGRQTRMHGHVMGSAMGVNTWAAFAGSDDQAIVDGDIAMVEPELQGVL